MTTVNVTHLPNRQFPPPTTPAPTWRPTTRNKNTSTTSQYPVAAAYPSFLIPLSEQGRGFIQMPGLLKIQERVCIVSADIVYSLIKKNLSFLKFQRTDKTPCIVGKHQRAHPLIRSGSHPARFPRMYCQPPILLHICHIDQ